MAKKKLDDNVSTTVDNLPTTGKDEIKKIVIDTVSEIVKTLVQREVKELAIRAGLQAAKKGLI